MPMLKRIASLLPPFWQNEMKRIYFRRQIRRNQFVTTEPEREVLPSLISPGDWVIDVGANIGQYTKQFSELVGEGGRVIAFEPVPETFSILSANVKLLTFQNVTLINMAVSNKTDLATMTVPIFDYGLKNFYEARLQNDANTEASDKLWVMTICLDDLHLNHRVALVKIDVEDHEQFVLLGMRELLCRDHPTLILETGLAEIDADLRGIGYLPKRLTGSPNVIFIHNSLEQACESNCWR
jgi:FkbM family methyltransferase